MSVQGLTALITAIAGLATAIGALWHSQNTRQALKTHHKLTKHATVTQPSRPDGSGERWV